MYVPKQFEYTPAGEVLKFVQTYPFGLLLSTTNGRICGTHLPFHAQSDKNGNILLTTHLSMANPQWKDIENQEVMVVFSGAHGYISSGWYDHENVPTWNYEAVHLYGRVRVVEEDRKREILKTQLSQFESGMPHPVTLEGLSSAFLESHIRGIQALEIYISDVNSASKLSQNRDAENFGRITEELDARGGEELAKVMREKRGEI